MSIDQKAARRTQQWGQPAVATWTLFNGCMNTIWPTRIMTVVAANGYIKIVQRLHESGLADEISVFSGLRAAIDNGYEKVVSYLVIHCEAKCFTVDIRTAVKYGQFRILEWLLQLDPIELAYRFGSDLHLQEHFAVLPTLYFNEDSMS